MTRGTSFLFFRSNIRSCDGSGERASLYPKSIRFRSSRSTLLWPERTRFLSSLLLSTIWRGYVTSSVTEDGTEKFTTHLRTPSCYARRGVDDTARNLVPSRDQNGHLGIRGRKVRTVWNHHSEYLDIIWTLIFVRLASLGERSAETLVETRCDTGLGWHQSNLGNSSNSVFISYHPRPVSLVPSETLVETRCDTGRASLSGQKLKFA